MLMLSLILIAFTLLLGKLRKIDHIHYLYFSSFLFLVTGIALALLSILLPLLPLIRAISFEQLQPIVISYIEVVLPTSSVTTTLIAAFLVRPYFRKTQITNDLLKLTISQLQLKDINDKYHIISQGPYSGYVIQCALRVVPEHFAVPTVVKNAIGWVALINKKNMIELHGTYSPWAYGFNYVVDVVGEESLILFFIICGNLPCNPESVQKALNSDGVTVAFPVPPSFQLRAWDGHLAVAFKVSAKGSAKEQNNLLYNLWLHVKIGGLDALSYDKEFRLIDLIKEMCWSKNVQKQQKVKNFLKGSKA
jgi:hypothetical protein